MNNAWKFFKFFINKNSTPLILIIFGSFPLLYSIWGTFENQLWKETWNVIGKTIVVSGVFAGTLKLMQFQGVFKEEIEKTMFEPRFLKNRRDIVQYWEKLSQELFKNKFPGISKKLLTDVKEYYLPTQETIYYDEQEHFIEIALDDQYNLLVKHNTTLTILGMEAAEKVLYEFHNGLSFAKSQNEVSYSCEYIKVNGKIVENFSRNEYIDTKDGNKSVVNEYSVLLNGSEKYEIERQEVKKYSLLQNDLMYFRSKKLTSTLKININCTPNLSVMFKKMGTLEDFITKQNGKTFKKFEYKGIIYKSQGYILQLKKIEI